MPDIFTPFYKGKLVFNLERRRKHLGVSAPHPSMVFSPRHFYLIWSSMARDFDSGIPLKQVLDSCTCESSSHGPACLESSCRCLLITVWAVAGLGRTVPISFPIPFCVEDGWRGVDTSEPPNSAPFWSTLQLRRGPRCSSTKCHLWVGNQRPATHWPYHTPCGILGKERIKVRNRGHVTDE